MESFCEVDIIIDKWHHKSLYLKLKCSHKQNKVFLLQSYAILVLYYCHVIFIVVKNLEFVVGLYIL